MKRNLSKFFKAPFDIISLPSAGLFYPNKKSTLMLRYLNSNDEILLTSPSMIETGKSLDILLESVILDEKVKLDDLISCDKKAILLYLRSTTYGDNITYKIKCPVCTKESESILKLSEIESKEINYFPDENGNYTYDSSKYIKNKNKNLIVVFKPLTVGSERLIQDEINRNESVSKKELTTKIKHQIISINGNEDKKFIEKIIENLPIKEFASLRNYIEELEPGFEDVIKFSCPHCSNEFQDSVYIDDSFLKLNAEYRTQVMEECFLAYYYGKGITRNDAYKMPVFERRWTINRIAEEIEKKAKAEEDAMRKAKSKK